MRIVFKYAESHLLWDDNVESLPVNYLTNANRHGFIEVQRKRFQKWPMLHYSCYTYSSLPNPLHSNSPVPLLAYHASIHASRIRRAKQAQTISISQLKICMYMEPQRLQNQSIVSTALALCCRDWGQRIEAQATYKQWSPSEACP